MPRHAARRFAIRPAATAALLLMLGAAQAAEFELGEGDLKLRWDNTLKYSAAARTGKPQASLLASANGDDGDRNFGRGLISNRLDLLSEFDARLGAWGLRVSAAGWYDDVYTRRNDNPGPAGGAVPNAVSVPNDRFTAGTRRLHGRDAEWLDAFVFGSTDLGGSRLSFRLGRHGVVWGESLFFGANAIAAAQGPVDVVKLQSVPGTQFKEAIRPVSQLSAQLQLTPTLGFAAYYQFQWEADRLPSSGSYFAWSDLSGPGAERLLLPEAPNGPFLGGQALRQDALRPRNGGQGGLQMRLRSDDTDYGVYLVRYHSKAQQMVPTLGVRPVIHVPGPGCVVQGSFPTGPAACGLVAPVGYRMVYQQGITALGASASRTFGDINVAIEASMRRNMDLASTQGADAAALGAPPSDNSDLPAYALGRTAHVNVSALWQLPATPLFSEATMAVELAWNRVLSITLNPDAVDPNATRSAWALRLVTEPLYRQVLPGLDLGVPIGLGYAPRGSRSMVLGPGPMPPAGGGDLSLGVNGTYLDVWRFSLAYTHYFGSVGSWVEGTDNRYSYRQALKDRDFVALSLRRSF